MSLLSRLTGKNRQAAPAPPPPPAPSPAPPPPKPLFRTIADPAREPKAFASLPGSDPALLARHGATACLALEANPAAIRLPARGMDMFAVRDFVSPAECAELIALIDADVKMSTSLAGSGRSGRRTSQTCHLSHDVPIVAEVERRMTELLGLPASHSETVQGQRYLPGQQFMIHNDYFAGGQSYSDTVFAEGGQRSWTAMVFLSAPGAGGCTRFPRADIEILPVRGTLLTWNNMTREGLPNGHSHHAGTVVEAGVKHVLTKWYREYEWHSSAASNALRG